MGLLESGHRFQRKGAIQLEAISKGDQRRDSWSLRHHGCGWWWHWWGMVTWSLLLPEYQDLRGCYPQSWELELRREFTSILVLVFLRVPDVGSPRIWTKIIFLTSYWNHMTLFLCRTFIQISLRKIGPEKNALLLFLPPHFLSLFGIPDWKKQNWAWQNSSPSIMEQSIGYGAKRLRYLLSSTCFFIKNIPWQRMQHQIF